MKLNTTFIFFLSWLVLSCDYNNLKQPQTDLNQQFSMPAEKISELSYNFLYQSVFLPKCISCHGNSGNINLETYSNNLNNLELIQNTVFIKRTMPKRSYLSIEEQSALWNWIRIGAPEKAINNHTDPIAEPLVPTYDSIKKHVLQTSCKDCHNSTGSGKRILLDKESLLNSPLELIIPGNPDESGLIIAIERADDKRMPSAKEGYSELNGETKLVISSWIQNGAKD